MAPRFDGLFISFKTTTSGKSFDLSLTRADRIFPSHLGFSARTTIPCGDFVSVIESSSLSGTISG
jgi:hypothetical protein